MSYFPETENMPINVLFFMLLMYGYILLRGAMFIGEGSEKLLLLYGAGFIGGIILPIVNVIPDCLVVIISGSRGGSIKEIQHELQLGLGTLMGSSLCLLTLRYAICNLFGLRDLKKSECDDHDVNAHPKPKLTNISLFDSGNAILAEVPSTAKIMLLSTFTFFVIQIPALIYKNEYKFGEFVNHERPFVLAATIIAFGLFFVYCFVQYFSAGESELVRLKQEKLRWQSWQTNMDSRLTGEQYQEFIFKKHDRDNSGYIEPEELKDALNEMGLSAGRETMKYILDQVDIGNEADGDVGVKDGKISINEFKAAVKIWMKEGNSHAEFNEEENTIEDKDESKKSLIEMEGNESNNNINNNSELPVKKKKYTHSIHENEDDFEEDNHINLTDCQLISWAIFHIIQGTVLCCIFTEPLVDVLSTMSKKLDINPFFVSLVLSPFVLNFREIYEGIPIAKRKTSNSISLLLYQLTGTVTMNNTLVLGIFMAIIYSRNLPWIYSSEIFVLLFIIFYVGFNTLKNTIKLWQTLIILLLYPISVVSLYLLKRYTKIDN